MAASTRSGQEHHEPHLDSNIFPEQSRICRVPSPVHYQQTTAIQSGGGFQDLLQTLGFMWLYTAQDENSYPPSLIFWPHMRRARLKCEGSFLTHMGIAAVDFGADLALYF